MPRTLEMHVRFDGEEFPVSISLGPDSIRIDNGEHGKVYLSWDDFDRVCVEAGRFREAGEVVGQEAGRRDAEGKAA